ncbi:hypothetical protein N6H14_32010 [Paenibacillus sp. CC-CFT747]|nr:hypothetical protein N6H14_32010 [Paenibacillus sp. CC-CFT747]
MQHGGNKTSGGASPAPGGSAAETGGSQPVTLTVVSKDFQPEDANVQRKVKAIEEAMKADGKNVKLQVLPVQSGTYSEKLGLILQSGNIPDLIYFQGETTTSPSRRRFWRT